MCLCDHGYEGSVCGSNADECDPDPCLNGGQCVDGVNRHTCTCTSGYTGDTCGLGMFKIQLAYMFNS